ncbi:MAG: immunity 17 family protein [Flavobacteriaceae bacterium]|nr:immunity 17 family protein [Flavobacteriaceae bacterium]
MESVFEYLKAHFEFVLIGFGLLVIIGSILRWSWILEPSGKMKNSFICSAIIDKWGENGLRAINIFLGTLLIICGVLFLILGNRG